MSDIKCVFSRSCLQKQKNDAVQTMQFCERYTEGDQTLKKGMSIFSFILVLH